MAVITRIERKSRRWEQVWQGDSEAVAHIVAGRLEAEGIRTRVHGRTTPYRTGTLALGGVWGIMVPGGKAEHARELLRENNEDHNVIDDESEGLTAQQRMTLRWAIRGAIALGIVIGLLVALEAMR